MSSQLDPARLAQALQELGVTPAAVHAIRTAPPDKARVMLDELKQVAKHRYRALAKVLHPDQNGGDPAKTEKFSFLSQVIKQVEMMEVRPSPPAPPPMPARPGPPPGHVIRHVIFRPMPAVSIHRNGTATTAGPTRIPHGIHVVFLRPT